MNNIIAALYGITSLGVGILARLQSGVPQYQAVFMAGIACCFMLVYAFKED